MKNLLKEAWWRGYKMGLGATSKKIYPVNENAERIGYETEQLIKDLSKVFYDAIKLAFKTHKKTLDTSKGAEYLANDLLPDVAFNKFYVDFLDDLPFYLTFDLSEKGDHDIIRKAASIATEKYFTKNNLQQKIGNYKYVQKLYDAIVDRLSEDFENTIETQPEIEPEDHPEFDLGIKKPGRPKGTGVKKNVWTVHR